MGTNLIIGESFDYILLFILFFLPFFYKFLFWLYSIQLKEYRWDRFKEYLSTKQGKNAVFNIFSILELFLFILSIIIWFIYYSGTPYYIAFWGVFYHIFFWYLLMLNIFVIGKIIRKKIIKPKITSRLVLIAFFFALITFFEFYILYIYRLFDYTYVYILTLFLFLPVFLFVSSFIISPIVLYKKNKIINLAISKSIEFSSPIKIGITGSYGKSSSKEFLSSILTQHGNTLKTPKNINTEMGVSHLILNKLNNSYKYFVAEMGAYKIGEISLLGKIVNHKYGFLTAIGTQHIGIFGSQENIIKGKSEIAESVLKNDGILYVNWDNENIKKSSFDKDLNIIRYGKTDGSDAKYSIESIIEGKTKFNFQYKDINCNFEINFIGEHNILNLSGVLAFLYDIGLKTSEISKYLQNLSLPENILGVFKSGNNNLLNDTYNISIDGVYAGIDVLKTYSGNKVLVIDDILELGKYSKQAHFDLGKNIGNLKIVDKIIYCGINYKKYFLDGLNSSGFAKENILISLDNIKKSTILFEGRGAKYYFDKLNKN